MLCEHRGEPPRLLGIAKVLPIQSKLNLTKEIEESCPPTSGDCDIV